jgi:hypothetical protein
VQLDALLAAHADLRVERPPLLWPVEADDATLLRVLELMIVAALGRGTDRADVVLRTNNVTVEYDDDDEDDEDEAVGPPQGDFVAISILGQGNWEPEIHWGPRRDAPRLVSDDLDAAARAAGVPYAYTRSMPDGGSVTVFLRRLEAEER